MENNMKAHREVGRRLFLKQSSALVGLAALIGNSNSFAAVEEPVSASQKKAQAIEKVLEEMEKKGKEFLSVARKDGEFLQLLVKTARARNVLEIGTSHGYATIWIGRALEETGGKITTIEIMPERVQLAKTHVERAGLSQRVTFLQGDAHELVGTFDGPFDFVMLDADKERERDYFEKLFPRKLAPGCIIAAHNAIKSRDAMKDYLDRISQHPEFDTVVLSLTMDDGFAVSYRHRA
jgi:caffeoyl-CoA O-methyltransferase